MTRDTYATREEAEADGWVKSPPAGWTKVDTSGYCQFGYEFTATSPDGSRRVVTHPLYFTGITNRVGNKGAVSLYYRDADFREEADAT